MLSRLDRRFLRSRWVSPLDFLHSHSVVKADSLVSYRGVVHQNFSHRWKRDLVVCRPERGRKETCKFSSHLSTACAENNYYWHVWMETYASVFGLKFTWSHRTIFFLNQTLDGSPRIPQDFFYGFLSSLEVLPVREQPCPGLFWVSPVSSKFSQVLRTSIMFTFTNILPGASCFKQLNKCSQLV